MWGRGSSACTMSFKRVSPSEEEGDFLSTVPGPATEVIAYMGSVSCVEEAGAAAGKGEMPTVLGPVAEMSKLTNSGCYDVKGKVNEETERLTTCSKQTEIGGSVSSVSYFKEAGAETEKEVKEKCFVCGRNENVKRCSQCKCAKYCSKRCQKEHWVQHEQICTSIAELQRYETDKIYKNKTVRQNLMDTKTKLKMVKMIGEKPKLLCNLGGVESKMLLDTGSGVTMVDRQWVSNNCPEAEVKPVEESYTASR